MLPGYLLAELQRYIEGDLLYVPSAQPSGKRWGEKNGTREKYRERNEEIRSRHKNGERAEALSREYALSRDSIKKIIYAKITT